MNILIDTTQTAAEEVGIALRIDISRRLLKEMWKAHQKQQDKIQKLLKEGHISSCQKSQQNRHELK